jgi:hypothetical protein
MQMKKKTSVYKHNPLPTKPKYCSVCSYVSKTGPNDLQLHMDTEHKGWAERAIKKMDIHERE